MGGGQKENPGYSIGKKKKKKIEKPNAKWGFSSVEQGLLFSLSRVRVVFSYLFYTVLNGWPVYDRHFYRIWDIC